ncbi:MAG: hypothetical protein Q7U76_08730 [Nitrospirota bacterium]|nr:hypothetical protein [Nitrospirota bacterium]
MPEELFPLVVAHITIHVEAAEGTLERIDHAVMIFIEFLEMLLLKLTNLGIWRSPCLAIPAGVITLRLLEHAMIGEIRLRLNDSWGAPLFPGLPMARDLPMSSIYRRFLKPCGQSSIRLRLGR